MDGGDDIVITLDAGETCTYTYTKTETAYTTYNYTFRVSDTAENFVLKDYSVALTDTRNHNKS